ncbi:MAG: family 10 glycosylhydrolase [Leptolyngbyaceae cyanobacterium bins.59]|nr:family 10 glycosylhydrolase [Leptolyngbyaceae cyanobacterium bins.59]
MIGLPPDSPQHLRSLGIGLLSTVLSLLLQFSTGILSAQARAIVLGVVRNQYNAAQWEQLTTHLQTANVAYRTIDLTQVKTTRDLAGVTVLTLPSVENLTLDQIIVLRDWISQGGRVVTGQQWQTDLNALLTQTPPLTQTSLTQTPPHPQGQNQPSPASVPQPARTSQSPVLAPSPPSRPLFQTPSPPSTDPAEAVAPPGLQVEPGRLPITVLEAVTLRQELENLAGRVESALLMAEVNSATTARRSSQSTLPESSSSKGTHSLQPLTEARQGIRAFTDLVGQRNYAAARQVWLQTRNTLWASYPLDQPVAQPEIRAVWLDRGTIVRAGSEAGLTRVFDRLAAAGINTVFIETINAGYPIYPSQVASQKNPLIQGWDPLAVAVKLGHARKMEVHAWVWVFAGGHTRHNALLNLPPSYPGPVIAKHPIWANRDNRGAFVPIGQNKPFLDPANPEVRSYLIRLFSEIVTRYDVDGLQFDYIRYPFQDPGANRTYGYGLAARQQFEKLTGVDPITLSPRSSSPEGRSLWQRWTEFRAEQVNRFVAEASQELRRLRPNLILSAAVFPLSEHDRLHKLQQQWESWAKNGHIDLLIPMSYAADTNRFQRLIQPWMGEEGLGATLLSPGIYLLNLPETATIDQIQTLRNLPTGGYVLFAAEHLSDRLQQIFTFAQGNASALTTTPIPYRHPLATAAARFTALQQEWELLLSDQQLRLSETTVNQWRTQSQTLQQTLSQLAANPSEQQFSSAQVLLTRYRSQFKEWMRFQPQQQNSQIQNWEYRLAAIETLLRYGERRHLQQQALEAMKP